jgi:hypothetical protein
MFPASRQAAPHPEHRAEGTEKLPSRKLPSSNTAADKPLPDKLALALNWIECLVQAEDEQP